MSAVDPRIADLTDLLEQELSLYGDLLRLGERERELALGNDPSELNLLVAEKQRIVLRVARVETERQAWTQAWACAHSLPTSVTLVEMTQHLTPAEAKQVSAVRATLLARIQQVAEMNNRNNLLLNQALHLVNRSLDAFNRFGSAGYAATGQPSREARVAALDRRI